MFPQTIIARVSVSAIGAFVNFAVGDYFPGIRLMRLDSTRDRIEWLSFRGGDDVLNTYEALFPRSMMPRFCRFVFWTTIAIASVGLCAIVILKASGR
jgi:hypothetical protein